jgi:hypothetical protein
VDGLNFGVLVLWILTLDLRPHVASSKKKQQKIVLFLFGSLVVKVGIKSWVLLSLTTVVMET